MASRAILLVGPDRPGFWRRVDCGRSDLSGGGPGGAAHRPSFAEPISGRVVLARKIGERGTSLGRHFGGHDLGFVSVKANRFAKRFLLLPLGFLFTLGTLVGCESNRAQRQAIQERIRVQSQGQQGAVGSAVSRAYEGRDYAPAWLAPNGLTRKAGELRDVICSLSQEPLTVEDGLVPQLRSAIKLLSAGTAPQNAVELAEADLRISKAMAALLSQQGAIVDEARRLGWNTRPRELDTSSLLRLAFTDGPKKALAAAAPPHSGYQRLRQQWLKYHRVIQEKGWPGLAKGPAIPKNQVDERIPTVRKLLWLTGDVTQSPSNETRLDESLQEGVKKFQERHGLEPSGGLTDETLSQMRVGAEQRLRQMEINLERWRFLPAELGARHLLVNLSSFDLTAWNDGRPYLTMRVIVGKKEWETPIFSDKIEAVVVNPDWKVTDKIAAEELLPRLQENSHFARKLGMRILSKKDGREIDPEQVSWASISREDFPYKFEQEAGPDNPLGNVKFPMPNRYSIYLHGTTKPDLFNRGRRTFSHGCVRVENPYALARFLLKGVNAEPMSEVDKVLETEQQQRYVLADPVPVHLVYFTAFVDPDETLQFRSDVYGLDETHRRESKGRHRLDNFPECASKVASNAIK